jgi:hypothetical protein
MEPVHIIGCKPQGLAAPLHSAILGRLTAGDQDQEVKDAAISAMATELALLGDVLSSKLPDTLQVAFMLHQVIVTYCCALSPYTVGMIRDRQCCTVICIC